jgi:hypothetical protein
MYPASILVIVDVQSLYIVRLGHGSYDPELLTGHPPYRVGWCCRPSTAGECICMSTSVGIVRVLPRETPLVGSSGPPWGLHPALVLSSLVVCPGSPGICVSCTDPLASLPCVPPELRISNFSGHDRRRPLRVYSRHLTLHSLRGRVDLAGRQLDAVVILLFPPSKIHFLGFS